MSDQQASRRTPRKKTPSMAPLYGAIGFAILAIVVIAMAQKDKDARSDAANREKVTTETTNPFGDIPAGSKVVPSPFGNGGAADLKPSASGLLASKIWVDALVSAERAKTLLKEANDADQNGNRKTYKKKALQARELFSKALEDTAEWEYEISEAHGEADLQVSKVRSLRSVWFDQRKKLRSVDVNDI